MQLSRLIVFYLLSSNQKKRKNKIAIGLYVYATNND